MFLFLLLGVLWPNDELYAGTEEVTKADYEIFVNGKEVFSDSGFMKLMVTY